MDNDFYTIDLYANYIGYHKIARTFLKDVP